MDPHSTQQSAYEREIQRRASPNELDGQRRFIARLPKVELHLHLEGSLSPHTLRELARGRPELQASIEAWIAERESDGYRYRDFAGFIRAFVQVAKRLETPEDYALAATRLIEDLAQQNVRYAEITLSAGVVLWKEQSLDAVFNAVVEAQAEASQRTGVRAQWIFDAVRQFGEGPAMEVVRWAERFRDHGVVAFGIGGDEVGGPAKAFKDVFCAARDAGLHVTAHAGESAGPESIRDAVEILEAERIGHALTAARDATVMALLRDRQIPVEVCLTSNRATGSITRLEDHPLPTFLSSGLDVSLNSDDPGMFGTSLHREFRLAAETFGLGDTDLIRLAENAIRASFLSSTEKALLVDELRRSGAQGAAEGGGSKL